MGRCLWRIIGAASDDAGVIGSRDGVREPVPGFNFAACPVDYPFQENDLDLHFDDVLYLRSYPYLGEEKWGRGTDDSLRLRGKGRWTRLMVAKKRSRAALAFFNFAARQPR